MNSKIIILLSILFVFSMAMVLAGTPTLIFPDSFVDTNASTECSGDEVLLGNGSCQSSASYGGGGSDGNASSICLGDEVLLGNGTCYDSSNFGGGGGNPFDQSLNKSNDVEFNQVNVSSNSIIIDGDGGTFGNGLISFANSTGGHNQWIEMYDDGIYIASGGSLGWVQILGDLSLWDDIQPMVLLGGIPDTWYRGWFGISQNLTVNDTTFTDQLCLSGDCKTAWPTGGGSGDGNASSICANGEFLNGDGTCDSGFLDADGVDTDTNETTRFTRLVDTACGSNEYVYDVHVNGTVLCRNDGLNGSSVSSGKKEIFFPSTDLSPEGEIAAEGTSIDVLSMSSSGSFRLNFYVPLDFTSMTGLYVVVVPDSTETIQYDLSGSHAAVGEVVTNSEQDSFNVQTSVTDNTLQEIDVSTVFSGLSAGDYAGLEFKSDTSYIRVLGVRFKYD